MPITPPSTSFLRRTFRPQWVDLAPRVLNAAPEDPGLDLPTARLWALVLASRHIPCRERTRSEIEGGGHTVQVRQWFADRAEEEIRLYLEENKPDGRAVVLPDLRPVGGLEPTVFAMAALVLFHWICSRTYPSLALHPSTWLDLGSCEARRVLAGEWWRIFTGLTLHGDIAHVMGNALIGGVFVWLAARRLGSGLAWVLVLLGGGLGNLLNAMAHGAPHNSIGFSTASFAAAGLLAGIAGFRVGGGLHGLGDGPLPRRIVRFLGSALLPVAAGLGLLAMLGAGEDTDLGAHLFGFASGLGIGITTGLIATRLGLPSPRKDKALLTVASAMPVLAWFAAWLA
ncbi:rhomboid family intramembrane serine protease [Pseudodesulfovibrio cashew]|uniref:Rhomboid family intramembrane serine protease n=2 Tax=Pseudodesulfovibrio cashew TaxID=2678688 RepID=A0A6I6JI89_9BACT|nr:rhomboid family intramembrane serine protease [Pseudodesulfovibrio cashew]